MWFFLALAAGLFFATNRLMVRSILNRGTDPIALLAVHEFVAGVLLLPVALINTRLPDNAAHWLIFVAAIFLFFITDMFTFLSLEKIQASLFQIIGQGRHIIVLLGAYLLFNEALPASKILAVALIIAGVAVALRERRGVTIKLNAGYAYAFLATASIALAFLAIKADSKVVSAPFFASIGLIGPGFIAAALNFKRHKKDAVYLIKDGARSKRLLAAAAIFALFELTWVMALYKGEASRVTPVAQSSMIFTLIGGYLFLNEKDRLLQKVLGGLVIAAGIATLYFV